MKDATNLSERMAQWEKERVKYGSYIRKLTANEVGERHVEGESL